MTQPKAICAAPFCEALTLCRGRRPHHARKEAVGTWETSSGPQSRWRSRAVTGTLVGNPSGSASTIASRKNRSPPSVETCASPLRGKVIAYTSRTVYVKLRILRCDALSPHFRLELTRHERMDAMTVVVEARPRAMEEARTRDGCARTRITSSPWSDHNSRTNHRARRCVTDFAVVDGFECHNAEGSIIS